MHSANDVVFVLSELLDLEHATANKNRDVTYPSSNRSISMKV